MNEREALARMVAPGDKRPGIWRHGVLQIHITRACDKACFGCTQGSNLAGRPVIMMPADFETAVRSLTGYFGVVGIFGGNPCLAAGTRVYTTDGIERIEDLENRVFTVRNLRGERAQAACLHRGTKRLYRVRLRGGHEYFATSEHEWPAIEMVSAPNSKRKDRPDYNPRKSARSLGKVKTTDLRPGMRLPIVPADSLGFGFDGTIEDGFLAGWLLGDGWIGGAVPTQQLRTRRDGRPDGRNRAAQSRGHRVRQVGLIVNGTDVESGIAERLSASVRSLGSSATWRAVKGCHELTLAHGGVDAWLERFGITSKERGLPTSVWSTASEPFRRGFVDGLFSADGEVEVSAAGFTRVRLTTCHEQLCRDLAELLGFYGIKTTIGRRERPGQFPNGKDYGKTYVSYTLSVNGTAAVERFAQLFPLTHEMKGRRLAAAVGRHQPDSDSDNIEIVAVEETDRHEDVWDISVDDDTHCFQLAHSATGNCMHPRFDELCAILRDLVPFEQRGLWCNHPKGKGAVIRETFNPAVSNLNVHQDQVAYDEFVRDWPECRPYLKGLDTDSRHSPPFVAMQDVIPDEADRWRLIADCDINRQWSAMICTVPGRGLRAYFCEIAAAQAMLHPDWTDTGLEVTPGWWKQPMQAFAQQVRLHCHACGIPLRRFGQLANGGEFEEVSRTHAAIVAPKMRGRVVRLVEVGDGRTLQRMTDYIENGSLT